MRKFFERAIAAFERRLATRRSDFVKFLGGIIKQLEQRIAWLDGQLARGRELQREVVAALENQIGLERREAAEAGREQAEQIDLLERKLAATVAELAGVQQSLELKNKALEVAEDQNETLWEVIERDRARVQAERHAYQRAAAEAENAARTVGVEAIEGE